MKPANNYDETRVKEYIAAVNAIFAARCGVSYTSLLREDGLERSFESVVGASRDRSPEAFVAATITEHGLRTVDDGLAPDQAAAFNRRRAALFDYARNTRDGWTLATDGALYRDEGGSVARLDVIERGGHLGWGVSLAPNADADFMRDTDDRLSRIAPPNGNFEFAAGGIDIQDAVRAWEMKRDMHLNQDQAFSL